MPTSPRSVGALLAIVGCAIGPPAAAQQGDGPRIQDEFVSESTGAATLSIPIPVPIGAGAFQPDLTLRYSSQAGDGPFGVGWGIAFGEIRRTLRYGTPVFVIPDPATHQYEYELDGEILLPGDGDRYHMLTERFWRIRKLTDSWEVTYPNGHKAIYGSDANARIYETSGSVSRWLLRELIDESGNTIRFTYDRSDAGVAYPQSVGFSYRGGSPSGVLRSIQFILESRPDDADAFAGGVRTHVAKRVVEIQSWVGTERYERLVLDYDDAGSTGRSRLASAQLVGRGCTSTSTAGCPALPAQTFAYSDPESGAAQWEAVSGAFPTRFEGSENSQKLDNGVRLADIDGDGRTDIIRAFANKREDSGYTYEQSVWLGTATGFAHSASWTAALGALVQPSVEFSSACVAEPGSPAEKIFFTRGAFPDEYPGDPRGGSQLADIDGDGRADIVFSVEFGPCRTEGGAITAGVRASKVYLNTGTGWQEDPTALSDLPTAFQMVAWCRNSSGCSDLDGITTPNPPWTWYSYPLGTTLADLNGDGKLDLLSKSLGFYAEPAEGYTPPDGAWLNRGDHWELAPSHTPPYALVARFNPYGPDGGIGETGTRVLDLNGDGLADILKQGLPDNPSAGGDSLAAFLATGVWLNTGTGWCADEGSSLCPDAARYRLPLLPSVGSTVLLADVRNHSGGGTHTVIARTGTQFTDLNGDGRVDLIHSDKNMSDVRQFAWINTPTGPSAWRLDPEYTPPASTYLEQFGGNGAMATGVRLFDADGNGTPDWVKTRLDDALPNAYLLAMALSDDTIPDLVTDYDNGSGGITSFEYTAPAQQVEASLESLASIDAATLGEPEGIAGIRRPLASRLVTSLTIEGIQRGPFSFAFSYAEPRWCPTYKSGLGYRLLLRRTPDGAEHRAYFYQQHGRAGRASRREIYDGPNGSLVWQQTSQWQVVDGGGVAGSKAGAQVARLVSEGQRFVYGAQQGSDRTAVHEYDDAYGFNFRSRSTFDSPSSGLIVERTPWAKDPTNWIAGLVASQKAKHFNNDLLEQTDWTYGATGLMASRTRYRGPNGAVTATLPSAESWQHDLYGNVKSRTDSLAHTEHYCYDGQTSLGPGSCPNASPSYGLGTLRGIRDAIGGVSELRQDTVTGATSEIYRYNGDYAATFTDSFGRPTALWVQPASAGTASLLETRVYHDAPGASIPPYVERYAHLKNGTVNNDDVARTASYSDGLGGVLREVSQGPTGWFGVARRFDFAGRVIDETYPIACTDVDCSSLTASATPARHLASDAAGRTTRLESPDGVELAAYRHESRALWGTTPKDFDLAVLKDASGRIKQRVLDGEQVIWADECHNGANPSLVDLATTSCTSPDRTFYYYLGTGRLNTIFDPVAVANSSWNDAGHKIFYGHNLAGDVQVIGDSDGGWSDFTYAKPGLVATTRNARLQTTTYEYDALDRPTRVLPSAVGEHIVSISYDPASRKPSYEAQVNAQGQLVPGGYQLSTSYDGFGRESRRRVQAGGVDLVTDFEYDLSGRLTRITYPESTQIDYEYTGPYLSTVDRSGLELVTGVEYDALGRLAQMSLIPGTLAQQYDPTTYRPERTWFTTAAGDRPLDLQYEYHPGGNIESIDDEHTGVATDGLDATALFDYDAKNRLSSRQLPNYASDSASKYFSYDALDNLERRDVATPSSPKNYFYADGAHPRRLTSRTGGAAAYTYDADGNITAREGQTLAYDSANRLLCVQDTSNCNKGRYTYDLAGTRLTRVAPGNDEVFVDQLFLWEKLANASTIFLYAEGRLIANIQHNGAALRPAWLPIGWTLPNPTPGDIGALLSLTLLLAALLGLRLGVVVVYPHPARAAVSGIVTLAFLLVPVAAQAGGPPVAAGNFRWVLEDHAGTSVVRVSSTGDVTERRIVEPFGRRVGGTAPTENTQKFFAGHRLDDDENLYPAGARTYDPEAARFTSIDPVIADPSDPRTLHPYAYAGQDPVNYVDPTGRNPLLLIGVWMLLAGAAALGPEAAMALAIANIVAGAAATAAGAYQTVAQAEGTPTVSVSTSQSPTTQSPPSERAVPSGGGQQRTLTPSELEAIIAADVPIERAFDFADFVLAVSAARGVVSLTRLGHSLGRRALTAAAKRAGSLADDAARAGAGSVDDILRPSGRLIGQAGSSSRIRIVEGGLEEAKSAFGRLSQGGKIVDNPSYPGTLVQLPRGTVGIRPVSGSGPPTIDVNLPGIAIREIKFVTPTP